MQKGGLHEAHTRLMPLAGPAETNRLFQTKEAEKSNFLKSQIQNLKHYGHLL